MSVVELNAKFSQWNPMENDYKNIEFNHYISGPGADLDAELQPAQQALQKNSGADRNGKQHVPSLIFKDLPKEMTTRAIHNICSRHGSVREVRDSTKNDYYFVDMYTVSDMEAVFRALENNNYGFKIMVGKTQNKRPLDLERNQSHQLVPPSNTGIDYENRNYRTSKKNHPRPKVAEDSLLNASDAANTGLSLNILTNDAHSLERQGLYQTPSNNKFNYRNGRSYVSMPEKTKQFIDKKHKESSGAYNDREEKYVHSVEEGIMPDKISKCSQCFYTCDTVCERCYQYYCSVECQKSDWPDHRYICGKPKNLQQTPPSKKESRSDSNSSKIPKENNRKAIVIETLSAIEEKTMIEISPEKLLKSKSSKLLPKQLQFSNNSQQRLASSKAQQPSNSLKTSPIQRKISSKAFSEQLSTSSKPPKKLPAALRTSFNEQPISSEESPQKVSKSSTAQNDSNKNLKNVEDTYKRDMPRSGNIVTITAISKTNVVFIRSTTYEDNISYLKTIDSLQSIGNMQKLQPLKTLPKSGEMVIAKFEEVYNRAVVLKAVNPTNIAIHFMDYGNMEQSKMEDLFEAPEEFFYKPRHAIPVILKNVDDCYMTEEIRKFMHTYLNNVNVEMRYKPEDFRQDNNVFAVELIDENTQQNLNETIMKLSKPVEPQNTNEICDKDYLEKIKLPVGKNVELIVMDNSLMCAGCISCTTKPYAIEINKFKKDIQAYIDSIPKEAYTPRVHELCIARYDEDGFWYRGVCVETVGDGYPSIHFIDYGNITIVPIESIRRYPPQFTFPIYTIDCTIEGLPEYCDDELVARMEDLIPNGVTLKCENVTVDEECFFYNLSLPNVIRELSEH